MRARLVTGYIPLPGQVRGPAEYGALGEKLGGVPVRKKAFYQRVEETWMNRFLGTREVLPRPSTADNPIKNNILYHCVQHQKTEWLLAAAREYPDEDVFVWVDYGIFHQPGVNNQAIFEFMERVKDDAIYAPGCWDKPLVVESAMPCWRFCGSVLAVPRALVERLHFACVKTAMQHVRTTNNVEWEVNTWARVEKKEKSLPWHWYAADHNVSQFTNLPKDEHEPA